MLLRRSAVELEEYLGAKAANSQDSLCGQGWGLFVVTSGTQTYLSNATQLNSTLLQLAAACTDTYLRYCPGAFSTTWGSPNHQILSPPISSPCLRSLRGTSSLSWANNSPCAYTPEARYNLLFLCVQQIRFCSTRILLIICAGSRAFPYHIIHAPSRAFAQPPSKFLRPNQHFEFPRRSCWSLPTQIALVSGDLEYPTTYATLTSVSPHIIMSVATRAMPSSNGMPPVPNREDLEAT